MIQTPEIRNSLDLEHLDNSLLSRKGLEKLDFLIMLIEAIEINGVHSMIITSKNIGLEKEFSNSVELWKTRAHNPLRKAFRRGYISKSNLKALIKLISKTADRLYPLLRQLLSNKEPKEISQKRWDLLNHRFTELIKERMNLRRVAIQKIIDSKYSYIYLRQLVLLLSFSSGPQGSIRLITAINDLK
tara:strand:- start:4494 stop:5054 length:561 start_codon:yes stop_codon:yes gene_type:complete